ATGLIVNEALKAVKALEEKGINARLINIHTIKPIDKDIIIKAAKETGRIITVEEHSVIGGLGEAVCSVTSEYCPVTVKRIGIDDIYGHSGPALGLWSEFGIDATGLEKRIPELMK
ncbi:MAG: transketolase family protein, partial [Clostridia bacterium]|nr:transketolase family protein [Clostridia bacterium]